MPVDPMDRVIADAVRADMARIYGEERTEQPAPKPAAELPSIFLSRQAD